MLYPLVHLKHVMRVLSLKLPLCELNTEKADIGWEKFVVVVDTTMLLILWFIIITMNVTEQCKHCHKNLSFLSSGII